jgi:hypothetical protein
MLVFRIPGTIRVLLVGKYPDSIRPLELALGSAQGTSGFFQLKRMFYGQPWTEKLNATDVIFISDIPDFRPDEADRLKTFVESGGGVFFILGENVHADNYNRLFFEPLAGIRLGDVTGVPQSESRGYFPLRSLDIKHPLFEGVFQTDIAKFQPLHFYRVVNLSGKNLESVLSLQDRRCLLGEISLGKGKLFLLTSSLDPQWSDLAYSSLFPPLAYRSVLYLSRWSGIEESIPVGRQIAVPVDSGNVQSKYRVEFPDGDEMVLIPDVRQKRFVLNLKEAPMPGFYHFHEDEKLICVKAANVDPVESDFRTVTRQELGAYFKPVDCRIVSETSRLARQVSVTRHGRELWKEMLMLAMAVLILEMLLMREGRYQNILRKRKSQERNL